MFWVLDGEASLAVSFFGKWGKMQSTKNISKNLAVAIKM
jgi:hypothetical protein